MIGKSIVCCPHSLRLSGAQIIKIIRFFVLSVSIFCIYPSSIGSSGTGLFIDTTESIPSPWETVDPAIVLRQRPVLIKFTMLAPDRHERLYLNFFAEVQLSVILEQFEANVPDGSIWLGTVLPDKTGKATLFFTNNQLSGTIRLNSMAYQVRHIEGPLHLVREIRLPSIDFKAMDAPTGPSNAENEVVTLVNLERQILNLHPLQWDSRLYVAALGHAQDMAQQDYFEHTSLDGRTAGTRITQAGYVWSTYGENIAAAYATPVAVVEGWMNSSGHRANILSSSFCDIGVGYAYSASSRYGDYWTQDFGKEQDVVTCNSAPGYHHIMALAADGGKISPSGTVNIISGGNVAFTMTPDPDYRVADVLVDGKSVGAVGHYEFYNVTGDHMIVAHFVRDNNTDSGRKSSPWIPLLLLEQ